MKYAHFFKSKKGCQLVISEGVRPIGKTIAVSNKKEAKTKSEEIGAKPWNF